MAPIIFLVIQHTSVDGKMASYMDKELLIIPAETYTSVDGKMVIGMAMEL